MAAGWATEVLGFIALGPANPASPLLMTTVGLAVLGLAGALVIVPTLPDLLRGLEGSGKARISAVWNSAFSAGAAIGPVLTALSTTAKGFSFTCEALVVVATALGLVILALSVQPSNH